MSKSLKRVAAAIEELGLASEIQAPGPSRTAQDAATAVGCELDQIVKSLIFQGASGQMYLFLTAGGNMLCLERAADVAGEALSRADANAVRAQTGFAIGGVSPIGHLNPSVIFADPRLMEFDEIFAAAGTPNHVFNAAPEALMSACNATVCEFTQ